ncbi:glycosyltransferase [Amylibacter sp.]|nr:glycosyltransferase [Amylibacter sp.]
MKFSLIILSRNSERFIEKCIISALMQQDVEVELIVQDSFSTDKTIEIIKSFNDERILLVSQLDQGIYDGLNKAIERCSGDVIGLLHSDDILSHDKVLSVIKNVFTNYKIDGVYSDLQYFYELEENVFLNRFWKASEYSYLKLVFGWMPPHPTLFLNRYVYSDIGVFDTKLRISSDYDFIIRLFNSGRYTIKYIPSTLYHMRLGGASTGSLMKAYCKAIEDITVIRKYSNLGLHTLLFKKIRKMFQPFLNNFRRF